MRIQFVISLLLLISINVAAQGIDISDYLKKIESGKIDEVKEVLPDLKSKHPDDPSILFLDGILTENGKTSVTLFSTVVNVYPESRYADAAVYRLYSYYYAQSMFPEATSWLNKLKKDYPSSPYIKIAEKNIPPLDQNNMSQTGKNSDKKIKYKYTIQAGAFSNKDNAISLQKQFLDAGYSSEIKEKTVAGTLFQVVYVGKFTSEEEAKYFLQKINTEYSLDGRVININ